MAGIPFPFKYPVGENAVAITINVPNDQAPLYALTVPPLSEPPGPLTIAGALPAAQLTRGGTVTVKSTIVIAFPEGADTQLLYTPSATLVQSSSQSASQAVSSAPITASGSSSSAEPNPISSVHGPTNSSPTTPSSGSKISAGAVAGAAIGCFIAGALLAGLILWFLWRRRRPSQSRDHEASKIALMSHGKGFSDNVTGAGYAISSGAHATATLPLPLEDKAITGEISKISNSIKNHVQSYYHTGRVNPGLIDVDDVQALGLNLPISAGALSTLLSNSSTREMALRFCIAWVACSRMLPNTESSTSLLPSEVAGFSHNRNTSNATSLARWRSSSADLLHSTYVSNAFSAADSRNKSIQTAMTALDTVLQPYADSRVGNEERRRNLEEILKRCASFAFTLFSQPSTWDFDWKAEQSGKNGELCIFPALVQLTDEHGANVHPPRPFSEAVVRKLDE